MEATPGPGAWSSLRNLIVLALGAWFATVGGAVSGDPGRPAQRPNVVVIVVDTLRADRVVALGARLPYLQRLRRAGRDFARAYSSSSWTPTATASIFTGLWPDQHGVRAGYLALAGTRLSPVDRLPARIATLPMALQAAGYVTLGISDNVNIGEAMGFARGFDVFVQHIDAGAERVTSSALDAVRGAAGRPYFLYLHPMDPHAPYRKRDGYRPPKAGAGADLARYDSEIVALDRALSRLHARLDWDRDTLLVFTADHGEAFGEHGLHGHPNQLFEPLLRVPLLLHAPGAIPPGRVDVAVSTVDILPTVRDWAGLPASHRDVGISLLPRARRAAPLPPRALFAMRYSDVVEPRLARRSVIADGFKLIEYQHGKRVQLFDLLADPGEQRDMSRSAPERTTAMRRLLARVDGLEHFESERIAPPAQPHDAPLLEQLRALGYVR